MGYPPKNCPFLSPGDSGGLAGTTPPVQQSAYYLVMFKLFCAVVCCGVLSSCTSPPEAPVLRPQGAQAHAVTASRLDALLPTDALLLGEQHDVSEHQQIHQQVIALLAERTLLGALVLEMADKGTGTAKLHPSSTEQQAKKALKWSDTGWPWEAYGPAVMTAVRAGVPVVGGNLPRGSMQSSMNDGKLDGQLPGPALKAQQQLIRIGHCNLLPESQITPMTRIQIAKDISMAETVNDMAVPGKVVVLLAGGGAAAEKNNAFNAVWATPAVAEKDYCADFKAQMGK